jgi:hypothetical protein
MHAVIIYSKQLKTLRFNIRRCWKRFQKIMPSFPFVFADFIFGFVKYKVNNVCDEENKSYELDIYIYLERERERERERENDYVLKEFL